MSSLGAVMKDRVVFGDGAADWNRFRSSIDGGKTLSIVATCALLSSVGFASAAPSKLSTRPRALVRGE
jgi:hypothetical protein